MNYFPIYIIIILILLNYKKENFNPENKYGLKTRISILSDMVDVILKCVYSPFKCMFFPTPAHVIGTKKGLSCNNNNPHVKRDKSKDLVKIGGLCYKQCPNGYQSTGLFCKEKCKNNEIDKGLRCYDKKNKKMRFKKNKSRGIGKIPNICSDPDTYKTLPLLCKDYSLFTKLYNRGGLLF